MSVWGSMYFHNGVSSMMEQLIFFHDYNMMIMIMIVLLVGYMLVSFYCNKLYNLGLFEGQELESVWTIMPGMVLLFIAFPSIRLLYLMEEYDDCDLTIKVFGSQWYWSYEYSYLDMSVFDSYMLNNMGIFRLLDVDNSLIVPFNINIRMLMSSSDVIHSWTIPSLGVKLDAIPGRLNQLSMIFNRMGLFSGQCSEICGSNHSFMPIMVGVIPQIEFITMLT